MIYRYLIIFFLYFALTFLLDIDFSNGYWRVLFALFGVGVIWLVQAPRKKESS